MTAIIGSFAAECFGCVKKVNSKAHLHYKLQSRQNSTAWDFSTLKKKYKRSTEQALAELRDILRRRLMMLWRAEWLRRWGQERARKQAAFIANPFGFTKQQSPIRTFMDDLTVTALSPREEVDLTRS